MTDIEEPLDIDELKEQLVQSGGAFSAQQSGNQGKSSQQSQQKKKRKQQDKFDKQKYFGSGDPYRGLNLSREEKKMMQQIQLMEKQEEKHSKGPKKKVKVEQVNDNLSDSAQNSRDNNSQQQGNSENSTDEKKSQITPDNIMKQSLDNPQKSEKGQEKMDIEKPVVPKKKPEFKPMKQNGAFDMQEHDMLFFYLDEYRQSERDNFDQMKEEKPARFQSEKFKAKIKQNGHQNVQLVVDIQEAQKIQEWASKKFEEFQKDLKDPFQRQISEFSQNYMNESKIQEILQQKNSKQLEIREIQF